MKNGRDSHDTYKYVRTDTSTLDKVIDVHDVYVKRSKLRVLFSYIGRLILLANMSLLLIEKDKLSIVSFWRLFLGVVSAKLLQYKPIKKVMVDGSVTFPPINYIRSGVAAIHIERPPLFQSLTDCGRIDRKFIQMGKILKPVLNECVTPVTCYWSLVLVLRDDDQLALVFQKLQPPIKILVPVWKALCKSTNLEDHSHSLK
ncbi:phosphatidylinositolglycan-like protein [Rhynchospora pubera]|uniref:Phosphatidylinositolglycan-like protein n=1 Tax=Rhynchospora pubera TaxID=906938 RepID=A0AAV8F851_9POAL|nr:phosphatidylinositolglycan-like protein [Rhynchospora pubera]